VRSSVGERRGHAAEVNVTRDKSESIFCWLSLVGIAAPPRDRNDEDEDDEEGGDEDDTEPAVIREPDED
jgi:hypothetical protein